MGAIYEWTFFLALGLLAIVVTVFVFAVSLLGRAIETASREQEKTTKEQKDATEREIAGIQKQISDLLGKKGRIDKEKLKELETKLKQLGEDDERFEKKLGRIRKASELLTVKGGIIRPGVSLLVALILNGVAWYFWYLSTIEISTIRIFIWIVSIEPVFMFIWIVSLVAILYSIFRIYKSLKAIERVAITSEEAALLRETEALKRVFRELEEERRPELQLKFDEQQPPFHVAVNSETKLQFKVGLIKGDTAENVMVGFHFPPGFSFPRRQFATQDADHPTMPNFVSARVDYGLPITRGSAILNDLVVKALSKVGEFPAYYNLSCRGFCSEDKEFKIVVE